MTPYWEGTLVRLRAVEPADAAAHHAFNLSADYALLDQMYPPGSLARVEAWAADMSRAGLEADQFSFQIVTLNGDELVGHIATHHADSRVGAFSYGVSVNEAYRGNGYAREAICLVLRYYFQERRYQKVNVEVMAGNRASLALHEAMGFVREGVRRRSAYTAGELYDVVLFGMTVEEFRERHAPYWRSLT